MEEDHHPGGEVQGWERRRGGGDGGGGREREPAEVLPPEVAEVAADVSEQLVRVPRRDAVVIGRQQWFWRRGISRANGDSFETLRSVISEAMNNICRHLPSDMTSQHSWWRSHDGLRMRSPNLSRTKQASSLFILVCINYLPFHGVATVHCGKCFHRILRILCFSY